MKEILTGICVICVAYAIPGLLTKENGTGRMTRFVCALCFLISLYAAVSGAHVSDFSLSVPAAADIDYTLVSDDAVCQAIGQMLEKEGINFEEITVSSYENGDGGISINEIAVYGAEDTERCRELIKDNTGLDKEVRVYE